MAYTAQGALDPRTGSPSTDISQKVSGIPIKSAEGNAKDELLEMLEKEHPERSIMLLQWRKNADIALERATSNELKARYLVSGDSEEPEIFAKRLDLSEFIPEVPELLNDFIGAIFGAGITRDIMDKGELGDRISKFVDAAGTKDQPLEEVSKQAARLALVFNEVDAFLDRPAEIEVETPRISLLTPEDRLDWKRDINGLYEWVKYCEHKIVQDAWDAPIKYVQEYRIITAPEVTAEGINKGYITLYRVIKIEGYDEIVIEGPDKIEYDFKSIPVRTLYWNEDGAAWITRMVDGDIKAFRQESDFVFDMFENSHSFLKWWTDEKHIKDKKTFRDLKKGACAIIPLMKGGDGVEKEDIEYIEHGTGDLAIQQDEIQKTRELIRRMSGSGADLHPVQNNPESGVALAYRQSQREKNYRHMAHNLQEWEWQLLELVITEPMNDIEALNRDNVINLSYPEEFDQRTSEQISDHLRIAIALGSSPTLVKELNKLLASKVIPSGMTAELKQQIMDEIDVYEPIQEEAVGEETIEKESNEE